MMGKWVVVKGVHVYIQRLAVSASSTRPRCDTPTTIRRLRNTR